MRIALISFTLAGGKLGYELVKDLNQIGHEIKGYVIKSYAFESGLDPLEEPLTLWTKDAFTNQDALIFIGATGICVRAIAPYVKDKKTDPAVLVLDERGQFVIPLLSGHLGGANELAQVIAPLVKGQPVITTATDINGKFAVDLFAKSLSLNIMDMTCAKDISAAVLRDEPIGFQSDFDIEGPLPEELTQTGSVTYGIHMGLGTDKQPFSRTLHLIPSIVTLGIGCRKETDQQVIQDLVDEVLDAHKIAYEAIEQVVSVDLKKEEPGLVAFCQDHGWKFDTYTPQALSEVPGEFTESDFVKSTVGVGNICERAAVLGSQQGKIIQRKYAKNGVTVSLAIRDWKVKL